jgi:hypothetical protein
MPSSRMWRRVDLHSHRRENLRSYMAEYLGVGQDSRSPGRAEHRVYRNWSFWKKVRFEMKNIVVALQQMSCCN